MFLTYGSPSRATDHSLDVGITGTIKEVENRYEGITAHQSSVTCVTVTDPSLYRVHKTFRRTEGGLSASTDS